MPSETEAGEEDEVDVCAVERIPALCSRYKAQTREFFIVFRSYNARSERNPRERLQEFEKTFHVRLRLGLKYDSFVYAI